MTKPYDRGGLRGPTWAERERDSALSRAETAEFRWAQMRDRAEAAERERDEARAEGRAAHDNWMNAADRAQVAERERGDADKALHDMRRERDAVVARAEHRRAAAVARADQLRDERDDALSAGLEALGDAERDRDEWKARAEAAEARLADPYSQANQDAAAWDRVAAHPALRMDLLPDVEGSYADCVFERINWLAEVAEAVTEMKPAVAAEARTAPAVTKDEIRYAIRGGRDEGDGAVGVYLVHEGEATDAVWALVSGADPVEEKARELCAIAYPYEAWEMLAHRSQQEPLRRLAAHVLGQEDRHVDQ